MKVSDREAFEWRKAHSGEIEAQLSAFLAKVHRRSKSEKSREARLTAVSVFCSFLKRLPKEIEVGLKKGEIDPYKILDEFISYLSGIDVAPHTIKDYVSGVKKWMRFVGMELSNERLREVLEMPRQYAITKDVAPSKAELRKAVMASDERGKALITLLASSGMRIGEALSLRVKDINFSGRPVTVFIRPEVAKDRQGRYVFISDEATNFLKQYLGDRMKSPDCYVFQGRSQGIRPDGRQYLRGEWKNEPMSYHNAVVIFRNALKRAGIYREDENGRDIIHIHCLRKFFFTQMVPVLGREITEALMGHKGYLDSAYRRFTVEQLGQYYLKAMDHVTILKEEVDEKRIREEVALDAIRKFAEAFGVDPMRIRVEKQRELGREPLPAEELEAIQGEIRKFVVRSVKLKEDCNSNNCRRYENKIIREDELLAYLDEGWDIVKELSNGKIVLRKTL